MVASNQLTLPRTQDISVRLDQGYLRISWSKRIADPFYKGKRYKHLKRQIQADIDHPEGLFDPSLVKYLGAEHCAKEFKAIAHNKIVEFPNSPSLPKLSEIWDRWLDRLIRLGTIIDR